MERTLAIIKPDAITRGLTGEILSRIEGAGFWLLGMRLIRMTKAEAEGFYQVHRGKPFFESLTSYMSSGPSLVLVLEGKGAILAWRELMGATDPAAAAPGSIRKEYGLNIERNCVHGSDSPETAAFEIPFFFPMTELIP